MLISVVGTLITDNLTDNFGVRWSTTTIVFSARCSPSSFAVWYAGERTLSIHTIVTTRREAFYWLAVLFTFALGTAAGDLVAERLEPRLLAVSALIFGGLIALVALAHYGFRLNAVLAFWLAYILTRPLGASIGDYLSQPTRDGGLGLGTTVTSVIFLATILRARRLPQHHEGRPHQGRLRGEADARARVRERLGREQRAAGDVLMAVAVAQRVVQHREVCDQPLAQDVRAQLREDLEHQRPAAVRPAVAACGRCEQSRSAVRRI